MRPDPSSAGANTAAVLVTYLPQLEELHAVLQATLPQVDRVLVVDNGSPADLESALAPLRAGGRVDLLRLGRNFGIAHAHNRGLNAILAAGYAHALILDQDSVPAPDMVAALHEAAAAARRTGMRVSTAGPRYVDPRTGQEPYFVGLGRWRFRRIACASHEPGAYIAVDWIISSGMLIDAAVLREVGLMREELFIDEVDTEWCLRALARGYRPIGACAAVMRHTLGSDTVRVRFNRERRVPVHSPIRLYYILRNGLLLARLPHVPAMWWVPNLKRLAAQFVFFSTMIPPRIANLRMMVRGIRDGLLGRAGPYGDTRR
jgi:rhamnosyltransferase